MTTLFDQTSTNGLKLRNRLVRSATWEGMCRTDGRPTAKLRACYRDLAQGGIGLIISGYAYVREEGKQLPGKMGIHSDEFSADYRQLTDQVHDVGGTIAIQLVHAGGQTDAKTAGRQPLAPSAVEVPHFPEIPAELSRDEIHAIAAAFGEGARRAKAWGFDAIQLHGAHGYLINQFLSPLTNRRSDQYGGDIANRCRFMLDVYTQVRQVVGPDFPVLIKLNAQDNLDGGLVIDDALYAARQLSEAGIDGIEVSAGTPASGAKSPARQKINQPGKEAYHLALARRIKNQVGCPVMVVGGFRSYEVAEQAVSADQMDYIALSRPLIREPGLPLRWLQGDRSPAACISCNGCFGPGLEQGGIYCVAAQKEQQKAPKETS